MRTYSTSRTASSHLLLPALLVTCLILISACQQAGPTYHTQKDPAANFNQYRTFSFFEVSESALPDAEIADLFKQSLREKMEYLGYRYSTADPDLLIHYQANIHNTLEAHGNALPTTVDEAGFRTHERGLGLYTDLPATAETTRWSIERSGAARITIVDTAKMQTVWQGESEGSLNEAALIQPKQPIKKLVDTLFDDFPRRK